MMSEKMKCSINKIFLAATCVFALSYLTACVESNTISVVESDPEVIPSSFATSVAPLELNRSSYLLAVTGNDIYTVSALDGQVTQVFEAGSRSTLEFLSPADVVGNIAYVSASDNRLYAIDLETGVLLWGFGLSATRSDDIPSAPICSADLCYVMSATNELIVIRTETGEFVQSITLDGTDFTRNRAIGNRLPLITTEAIYIAVDYEDGSHALTQYSLQDGSLEKSIQIARPIIGPPVEVDGKLLIVAGRTLIAIDSTTFEPVWTAANGLVIADPVLVDNIAVVTIVDDEDIYFTSRFGTAGINLDTGTIAWTKSNPEFDSAFRPTSDGGLAIALEPRLLPTGVFAAGTVGVPTAINASDGSTLWDFQDENAKADAPPLAVPGYLFFKDILINSDRNSRVQAFNSRDGSRVFTAHGAGHSSISINAPNLILVHEGEVYRPAHFPTLSKQ